MTHAAGPNGLQDAQLGAALDGIKNLAREGRDKAARCARHRVRTQAQQGLVRAQTRNDIVDIGQDRRSNLSNGKKADFRHCTIPLQREATPAHAMLRARSLDGMDD
jgi:hypothetical protein